MSPLVLCTLVLIFTLLFSGIAKAKEPSSTATAIVNLKLDHLIPLKLAARTVPWGELALAAWLLFVPGWPAIIGGVASVILFAFYWIVIARAVFTGNTASCNCFGGESTAPISGYTLGRNTALLTAAVSTLIANLITHQSTLQLLLSLDVGGWLWLLGAACAAGALWCMYRSELTAPHAAATVEDSIAPKYTQATEDDAEADYVRLPIPYGMVENTNGIKYTFRDLAQTQARILFFLSSGCSPCQAVMPKIEKWQERLPMLKLHPVVSDQSEVEKLHMPEHIEVLIDQGFNNQTVFGRATPMVVALGADGLLAGGPVAGSNHVSEFMDDLMAEFEV